MKHILPVLLAIFTTISVSAIATSNDSTAINNNAIAIDSLAVDSLAMDSLALDSLALDSAAIDSIRIVLIPTPVLADSTTYFDPWTEVEPNILFTPIVFDKQQIITSTIDTPHCCNATPAVLEVDRKWLDDALHKTHFEKYHMNRVAYTSPNVVLYNFASLPEPPKVYVIKSEPNKVTLTLEEFSSSKPADIALNNDVKVKHWVNSFNTIVQFSQAYLSDNWYQGGNSNLNALANINYTVKLNTNVHPNLLFENYFNYKVSLNNAPQDSLRSYSIAEDLLQINSKFGIKAAKKWYYSATAQFKTQLLNNYKANTNDLKAAFLSASELNVGLGMTYNTANKNKNFTFNLSLSPVSYNLKYCRDIVKINPESYGIEKGRHSASEVGSNVEGRLSWNITPNISLMSRVYTFTDYDYLQGDWENTINFSINKFLSTQIYLHLRYDSSKTPDPEWKKWQFKEILSFGFNYKI